MSKDGLNNKDVASIPEVTMDKTVLDSKLSLIEVASLVQQTWDKNRDCLVAAYFLSHTDVSPEEVMLCQKVIPDQSGQLICVMWIEKRPPLQAPAADGTLVVVP